MAWIELHDNLPDHGKVLAVAAALRMDKDLVVGKLVRLWTWALNNREDGVFLPNDAGTIAEVMRFKGKAERLVNALVEARLLDALPEGGYLIHDWDERVGILIDRRNAQREYSKRKNQLYSDMRLTKAVKKRDGDTCQYCGKTVNWDDRRGADGGTYDHIDPDGENSIENLCVCCRACSAKKRSRTPWESDMTFAANSPLWQIYGRNYGRNKAEKRREISAITVPKPYLKEEDEEDSRKRQVRARMREAFIRGFNREPNGAELDGLEFHALWYDMELAETAVEYAAQHAANAPLPYVCSIMAEWAGYGISNIDELSVYEAQRDMREGAL